MTAAAATHTHEETPSQRRRTLHRIDEELLDIMRQIDTEEEDGEGMKRLESYLFSVEIERDEKLDHMAAYIREQEGLAALAKAEGKSLLERARIRDGNAKYLRGRMKEYFNARGIQMLETPRFRLSVAGHGGQRAVVLDPFPPPMWKIDKKYKEQPPEIIDMDAVRKALEAKKKLNFAHLAERGSSFRIK